ncbi:MAG: AsmA-like C-terminal region-containing protein [Cyclobacteriaceae bacterium]
MKLFKKILFAFGIVVILIIASAIVLPIVFKDKIKTMVDKEISKTVNADVVFEADNFSLSLFQNFPNLTAQVKDLGVFNRAPFEGIHLFVVERFEVEINLKDVIFGNKLRIKGITLVRPQINVKVLKDGQANYNITYPSTDTTKTTEPSEFSFAIDSWKIENAEIKYDDATMPFFLSIKGLNHSGRGDFNEKEFDLNTNTTADSVTVRYAGAEYISNKKAAFDAIISISEGYTKYVFKGNSAKLNDFALSFDGSFKMNENNYSMDINFKSPENSFKSLLSLVPGMYSKEFDKIETNGALTFQGFVKGVYSEKQMPAFKVELKVADAMFKYPTVPAAVTNIAVDLLVDNNTGIVENTVIDLKKLHLDFGSNPIDARARIENLKDYRMNANLKAALNLGELSKIFPIEGLEMKGIFSANASINGVYGSIKKIIPALDVAMSLKNGFVKSSKFPLPLEDLKFNSSIKNTSGKMSETFINVQGFSMLMDGEQFVADLELHDLNDYAWDLKANGSIDIEKMTKIFPVEGMTLAGKLKSKIETKGKYSDVTAKRFDRLSTSGAATLNNFKFASKSLPYEITVKQAAATFNPQQIELKNTTGTIGRSDFDVSGTVANYISYIFSKETIKGNLNFNSTLLDLNEFMTDTTPTDKKDTSKLSVIPIPGNIDFTLHSDIKTIKMMDYVITQAVGDVIIKNSAADLSNVKFNMLGGGFVVNGKYDTKDIKHPRYDFGLKVENLSIQQAANTFSIIKTYAPIAGMAQGKFGTDFKVSGELGQDMMPKMSTVNGSGLIKIAEAAVTQSKIISGITSLTKLQDADNVSLKDVLMSAVISDGKLTLKPFNVKFGNYVTSVSGNTALDGAIDYALKMNVPAGKLGSQVLSTINQNIGTNNSTQEIPVTINLSGTFKDPKTKLLGQEQKQQIKETVTKAVEEKGKEAIVSAVQGTEAKDLVNKLIGNKKDTTRVKSDSTKSNPVQDALQNKLQNLLKRKKN